MPDVLTETGFDSLLRVGGAVVVLGVVAAIAFFASDPVQLALVLLIFLAGAIRYVRGNVSTPHALLIASTGLVYFGTVLVDLTRSGPISSDDPLNYLLDGIAVCAFVLAMYALYRYRGRRE